jgi:predicted Zn finger-like uncharacterized protein
MFRVDPDKIPAAGIKARCSRCSAAFRIERQPQRQPVAVEAAVAAPPAPPPAVAPAAMAEPIAQPAPPRPVPAASAVAPPPPAAAGIRRPSFRNQDPASRAQRIARALVSDIVAYNKDKLKESLAAGTLRNDFRDEIRKSWEEYVGQVGIDMAKSAPYFRDSLNEILAKGQKIF